VTTEPTNQLKEAQRCLTDAAHLSHLAEIVSQIEIENITGDLDALAVQRDTHPEEPALRTLWAASVVNFITKVRCRELLDELAALRDTVCTGPMTAASCATFRH
jgi:hypothetical protein